MRVRISNTTADRELSRLMCCFYVHIWLKQRSLTDSVTHRNASRCLRVFLCFSVAVKRIRAAWESHAHRNTELKRTSSTAALTHSNYNTQIPQHRSLTACQSAAVKSRTRLRVRKRAVYSRVPLIWTRGNHAHPKQTRRCVSQRTATTATVITLASLEPIPVIDVGSRHALSQI